MLVASSYVDVLSGMFVHVDDLIIYHAVQFFQHVISYMKSQNENRN